MGNLTLIVFYLTQCFVSLFILIPVFNCHKFASQLLQVSGQFQVGLPPAVQQQGHIETGPKVMLLVGVEATQR